MEVEPMKLDGVVTAPLFAAQRKIGRYWESISVACLLACLLRIPATEMEGL